MPKKLTILYDSECRVCVAIRNWVAQQATYIDLRFLPMRHPKTHACYPEIVQKIYDDQFIVIDDRGRYYTDNNARIMCLYALKRTRHLSTLLAKPSLKWLSTSVLSWFSRNRHQLGRLMPQQASCERNCIS